MYLLAKQYPVNPPELFAAILSNHFVSTYKHIHASHIKIIVHRWTRMEVDGKPHPHSFFRDGAETRVVEAVAREGQGITIKSMIKGLLVLKSTGSAFYGFHRDEYTRLPEVWDRILSTEVEAGWQWKTFSGLDQVKSEVALFDKAHADARKITLETFAKEESPSVQNTMYKMCDQILAIAPGVEAVDYSLPNKHYFEIGMFELLVLHSKRLLTFAQIWSGTREPRTRARTPRCTPHSPIPTASFSAPSPERVVLQSCKA